MLYEVITVTKEALFLDEYATHGFEDTYTVPSLDDYADGLSDDDMYFDEGADNNYVSFEDGYGEGFEDSYSESDDIEMYDESEKEDK